jgi:hypothetical protein
MPISTSLGHYNDVRKFTKQKLLEFVKDQETRYPEQNINKTLALFSLQTGMKLATIRVYLDELRLAELL